MKKIILFNLLILFFAALAFGQTNKNHDTPVKIIHKPKAAWTEEAWRRAQLQGTVTLRVQFLESGEIGKVSVVIGMPFGLNESAAEAAKKIKFRPAMKEGKPVTVSKQVQYTFTLY